MLTFQREKWADLWRDAQDIFRLHYEELSLEKGLIPLGLDSAKYQQMEDTGVLHVLTARKDGKLVGYYLGLVVVHPHYKDAGLMSTTDMFYLLPEHRTGGAGAKLLTAAVDSLRARGVKKAFLGTKLKQDHTSLLEALGWTATDKVFTKIL